MRRLRIPNIDPALLAVLQARPPDDQRKDWDRQITEVKRFKAEISDALLPIQRHRCAYCGKRLEEKHRDHVAPKHLHAEWTFCPENIVISCYHCNMNLKRSEDVVDVKRGCCESTQYLIVHPYYDEPSRHFEFVGYRCSVLVRPVDEKGKYTIRLFDLDNAHRTKQRAKDALLDDDVEYLGGKWKTLFEMVLRSPLPRKMVVSSRS